MEKGWIKKKATSSDGGEPEKKMNVSPSSGGKGASPRVRRGRGRERLALHWELVSIFGRLQWCGTDPVSGDRR